MDLPEPPEGLVTYPANRVAAQMDDADEACAAIGELIEQDFDGDDIFALAGPEGAERLDVSGRHHGLQGRVYRLIGHIGDEREELVRAGEHLSAGGVLVVVPAADDDQAAAAAKVLEHHGGHRIVHFGRGHWMHLSSP